MSSSVFDNYGLVMIQSDTDMIGACTVQQFCTWELELAVHSERQNVQARYNKQTRFMSVPIRYVLPALHSCSGSNADLTSTLQSQFGWVASVHKAKHAQRAKQAKHAKQAAHLAKDGLEHLGGADGWRSCTRSCGGIMDMWHSACMWHAAWNWPSPVKSLLLQRKPAFLSATSLLIVLCNPWLKEHEQGKNSVCLSQLVRSKHISLDSCLRSAIFSFKCLIARLQTCTHIPNADAGAVER